ncbi:MAG: glycosyltransferase [Parabacteroides sp.]|nr:glycosyltransferase [Parabacteroides sp.]
MKVLLVTRGSQGDVLPYLAVARELVNRGHEVTMNIPKVFEDMMKAYPVKAVMQEFDNVGGMMADAADNKQSFKTIVNWTRDAIDKQFVQVIPLLEENDILVAANTEFAATGIAEYCRKPFVRTAFAPFLPGRMMPPPAFPFPKPSPIITPKLLWLMMNRVPNYMVKDTINKNRVKYGLQPIDNFGREAGRNSNNFLMYSQYLGHTDPDWDRNFRWRIGGYCFNDAFTYDEEAYQELMAFIRKEQTPVIFFTLGSCTAKDRNRFCEMLLHVCQRQKYRLAVGSGWAKTGESLQGNEQMFLMQKPIPHHLIFPHCDAVIHHGGSGTTHSVARAGKPQLITPLLLDQPYWAYRVQQLGLGPERVKIKNVSEKELEGKICDLVNNQGYKKNAAAVGEQIRSENGLESLCQYIEELGHV